MKLEIDKCEQMFLNEMGRCELLIDANDKNSLRPYLWVQAFKIKVSTVYQMLMHAQSWDEMRR